MKPMQEHARALKAGLTFRPVADTVAAPIEQEVNGVENMLYMNSQATTDGVMTLTVTFALGTDPDKAQQLVQNRVTQAEPRLPEEVRRLGVSTVKGATDLTMVVHLVSPDGRYDMTYLRNYEQTIRLGKAVCNTTDPTWPHVHARLNCSFDEFLSAFPCNHVLGTVGDRVRAVIRAVNRNAKGPQIVLSRTDAALLIKLENYTEALKLVEEDPAAQVEHGHPACAQHE